MITSHWQVLMWSAHLIVWPQIICFEIELISQLHILLLIVLSAQSTLPQEGAPMYSTNSAVRENSVELKTVTLDADSMWDFIVWLPYAIGFCVHILKLWIHFRLSLILFMFPPSSGIVALLRFARGLARLAHRTFLRKPFNLQERWTYIRDKSTSKHSKNCALQ